MPKIQISLDSDVPAETVLAAITDFSPRRPKLWPNLDPAIYKLHDVGADWADVTEGSKFAGRIWARERYDWSTPGVVRATVVESNIFKSGIWELKVTARDGGSHVELLNDRRLKGLRGSILTGIMSVVGPRIVRQNLEKTLAILREEDAR
jgi:hypothetical protein